MRAAAPLQLVIANAEWEYTIAPGTYRVAHDGTRRTRIDIAVAALTDPLASPVAPHGLLGDTYHMQMICLFTIKWQAKHGLTLHCRSRF